MSELQTETDAQPTPGTWEHDLKPMDGVDGRSILSKDQDGNWFVIANVNVPKQGLLKGDWRENARLIAAAGTAAQEAKEMEYDPVEVQKALPKILSAAEELLERVEDDCRVRNINPYDEPSFTALEYALASAEGSGE